MFWKLMDFIASSIGPVLIGLVLLVQTHSLGRCRIHRGFILFVSWGTIYRAHHGIPITRYTGRKINFQDNIVMWFAGSIHGFATVMTILLIQLDRNDRWILSAYLACIRVQSGSSC